MSLTVITRDDATIHVPDDVLHNLDRFRAWVGSPDVPEKVRTDFYKGRVWVDLTRQQVFTHVSLKGEFAGVLHGETKLDGLGRYWMSGVLVTNPAAGLSGNPDGVFDSHDALASGRMRLVPAPGGEFNELEGTADMVLEVVNDRFVQRDKEVLREAYWEAGIPEYWLVDARGEEVEFDLLQHGPKGYKAARKSAGWVKSAVFGKSFKLTRGADPNGNPEFTLEVK